MSDAAGAKALDLGRKLVSAERALAAIRAGSRIYFDTGYEGGCGRQHHDCKLALQRGRQG